jgi:hypothetical protein
MNRNCREALHSTFSYCHNGNTLCSNLAWEGQMAGWYWYCQAACWQSARAAGHAMLFLLASVVAAPVYCGADLLRVDKDRQRLGQPA